MKKTSVNLDDIRLLLFSGGIYPDDCVYENAEKLAAQWLVGHKNKAANPVINQIDFKSWKYTDLIMALREAYAAGMIDGASLQKYIDKNEDV